MFEFPVTSTAARTSIDRTHDLQAVLRQEKGQHRVAWDKNTESIKFCHYQSTLPCCFSVFLSCFDLICFPKKEKRKHISESIISTCGFRLNLVSNLQNSYSSHSSTNKTERENDHVRSIYSTTTPKTCKCFKR